MRIKPVITMIGPGALGRVLALALDQAGYTVAEIVSSSSARSRLRAQRIATTIGARAVRLTEAKLSCDVIWVTVPDGQIAALGRAISLKKTSAKFAVHSSGAYASSELRRLSKIGIRVASAHPMMSFVSRSKPTLQGVSFAIEGQGEALRVLRRIVADLGSSSFVIPARAKAYYHAFGAFASPLIISLFSAAELVGKRAGLTVAQQKRLIGPIVRHTIDNYFQTSAAESFSGPLRRGDIETIKKHVKALRKSGTADAVYRALASHAVETLPVKNKEMMRRLLRG